MNEPITKDTLSTQEICEQALAMLGWVLMLIGLVEFLSTVKS
jgi:hypothetical protein